MSARVPFVVGNWKMNGLAAALDEIEAMATAVEQGAAGRALCAICPPATLLARTALVARDILVGGQDCAAAASGAFTGDVSAEMLRDAGARLVIVGHSERRTGHHEGDAAVRAKAEAALRAGLLAIVCVGESQAQHDAGQSHAVVGAQLDGSLPAGAAPATLVVAYEPVWAIGTGRTPTAADVRAMHGFIRGRLSERLKPEAAAGVRILYGGSVKPDNAALLMGVPDVDGALVGGASLKAGDFLGIAGVYR